MKISFIIPMYNVEPYVERCILSLENQDIAQKEYEIICINDGSPDNSGQIVNDLQDNFNNLILYNQVNKGVSRARNKGIDLAKGKYVVFIDPDDYVKPNTLSRILNRVEQVDAEVFFLGYTTLDERGKLKKNILYEEFITSTYKGTESYFIARGNGKTDPDRMVGVLFRRDFLNKYKLRYLPNVPYLEDGEFIARIFCLAEKCIFDEQPFYIRTTRKGSATNSRLFHSDRATSGFLSAAKNLQKFQKSNFLNPEQKIFLNQAILKFSLLAINSSFNVRKRNKIRNTVHILNMGNLNKLDLRGCYNIYRLYGKAYNLSPYLAALTMYLYPRMERTLSKLFKVE